MAWKALGWVAENASKASLSGSEFSVAMSIASYVDKESGGGCFASIASIAATACCSPRTARAALRELQRKGFVAVEHDAAQHRPTTYCLPGYRAAITAGWDGSRAAKSAGLKEPRAAVSASRPAELVPQGGKNRPPGRRDLPPNRSPNRSKNPSEEPSHARACEQSLLTVKAVGGQPEISNGTAAGTDALPEWESLKRWRERHPDWAERAVRSGL
jgi:hypothetical protein